MDVSLRAPDPGSALLRLVAQLGNTSGVPFASGSLADRLTHWVDWRHAVALSTALDTAGPQSTAPTPSSEDDGEVAAVRASLMRAIDQDRAFAPARADAPLPDAAFFAQRYRTLQQVMAADVALVRKRLRTRLTQRAGSAARLAAVDAALEPALAGRERALLTRLPDLVAAHYDRLRAAAAPDAPLSWVDAFRRDLRALLIAELDFRLQPAEGLLAALGTIPADCHAP